VATRPTRSSSSDGKGVDGSSPSEGLKNPLDMQGFLTLFVV
jgi:hypothetical protein